MAGLDPSSFIDTLHWNDEFLSTSLRLYDRSIDDDSLLHSWDHLASVRRDLDAVQHSLGTEALGFASPRRVWWHFQEAFAENRLSRVPVALVTCCSSLWCSLAARCILESKSKILLGRHGHGAHLETSWKLR